MRRWDGSLTVEATFVVPLVFVVILPFLFVLRSVYVYDSVQSAVIETTELMQPLFFLTEKLPDPVSEAPEGTEQAEETAQGALHSFQQLLGTLEQIGQETGVDVLLKNLALQQIAKHFTKDLLEEKKLGQYGLSGGEGSLSFLLSDFLIDHDEYGQLFRIHVRYERTFPFRSTFASLKPVMIHAVARKYVGRPTQGDGSGGGQDAGEESETRVYYRLRNGTHYHLASCYMLDKATSSVSRTTAEARGYQPCGFCHPETLSVVTITEAGTKYHSADCYHIGGSVTQVTWEEIQECGYQPCAICIGGGGWFG